jgi:hypothetical protein
MTDPATASIESTLAERGALYGDFSERASLINALLCDLSVSRRWCDLEPCQEHALRMIVDKISRIANGDPHRADSWRDIAGYATLVVGWLEERAALAAKREARLAASWPNPLAADAEAIADRHLTLTSDEE